MDVSSSFLRAALQQLLPGFTTTERKLIGKQMLAQQMSEILGMESENFQTLLLPLPRSFSHWEFVFQTGS